MSFGLLSRFYENLKRDRDKKQIANTLGQQMKEPGFWARRLQALTYHKGSLDEIVREPEASQQMTAGEIKACFAKYYRDETRWTITIRPDAAAK